MGNHAAPTAVTGILTPEVRRYFYKLVYAAIPLLIAFGFIGPDEAQLWLNLAAAALGVGSAALALPNTPKSSAAAAEGTSAPLDVRG